jgi:hypothetical protein
MDGSLGAPLSFPRRRESSERTKPLRDIFYGLDPRLRRDDKQGMRALSRQPIVILNLFQDLSRMRALPEGILKQVQDDEGGECLKISEFSKLSP